VATLPVHCPHCGALFASRAFGISAGNIQGVTFIGNKETCINCGKMASIVDGTFDVVDGALKLIAGPALTKEVLQKFADLVERAVQSNMGPEELERQAELLDPTLKEFVVEIAKKSSGPAALLILLVLLLRACHFNLDTKVEMKVDLNKLWDQVAGQGKAYVPSKKESNNTETDKSKTSAKPTGQSSHHKGPRRVN
jgi:hypothetical protein